MTQVTQMDSNITGLRVADEDSLGVLPGSPVWVECEPNSYTGFGGKLKTVARNPINASRQRKKGVVVDLDAAGGFNSDLTQTNMQNFMQGFMFADFREKFDTDPFNGTAIPFTSVTTGPDRFSAASGLDDVKVGALVIAKLFGETANNGLHLVTAKAGTYVEVDETLTAESSPPAEASLSEVGFEFASAEVDVVVSGSLPKIVRVGAVAADGTLTFGVNAGDGDIVTIGDTEYTFKTALSAGPTVPYEILIGALATNSLDNLIAAINGSAGEGTTYSTDTEAHPDVTAAAGGGDTMDVTASEAGENGNSIVTTTDVGSASWTAGTLTGGAGKSLTDFGLVPGEFVFVGGDDPTEQFVNDVNNGFKRVKSVTADAIIFDKSASTMVAETGTALTIRLFFGRAIKNETGTLIKRRSYQFERTLGAPDDSSPNDLQAEYLVGCIANVFKLNMKTADKITADLDFIGIENEQSLADDGLKDGTRPVLRDSDALNTSSNVVRVKLAKVVADDEATEPLFAFATEFDLSIDNKASPNKAIGTIGAVGVTAGTFTVSGNLKCYFSDLTAVKAVRDNEDITFDFHLFKANAGVSIDVPLITLGDGQAAIEQDKPILLPLSQDAATGAKNDTNMNHTLFMVFYDYLPDLAG